MSLAVVRHHQQVFLFLYIYNNIVGFLILICCLYSLKDVEVVYTKQATAEQQRKAKELKLPLNFFLYEDAPPCPGCRGCEPEEAQSTPKPVNLFANTLPSTKAEPSSTISFAKMAEASVSSLSFSSLANVSNSGFSKPAAFSWSGAGQPIFGVSS